MQKHLKRAIIKLPTSNYLQSMIISPIGWNSYWLFTYCLETRPRYRKTLGRKYSEWATNSGFKAGRRNSLVAVQSKDKPSSGSQLKEHWKIELKLIWGKCSNSIHLNLFQEPSGVHLIFFFIIPVMNDIGFECIGKKDMTPEFVSPIIL